MKALVIILIILWGIAIHSVIVDGVWAFVFLVMIPSFAALYFYGLQRVEIQNINTVIEAYEDGKVILARLEGGRRFKISKNSGWTLENGIFFKDGEGISANRCELYETEEEEK